MYICLICPNIPTETYLLYFNHKQVLISVNYNNSFTILLTVLLVFFWAGNGGKLNEMEMAITECLRKNLGIMYLNDLCKNRQLQLLSFLHNIVLNKKFIKERPHLFEIRELFCTEEEEDLSNCLVILRNFSDQRSRKRWRERRGEGRRGGTRTLRVCDTKSGSVESTFLKQTGK